jgi:t-SNARE syntaxin family protein
MKRILSSKFKRKQSLSTPRYSNNSSKELQWESPANDWSSDVLSQLQTTRPLFKSYLRIRSLSTTSSSPELISAHSELETSLSTLAEDLSDLVASVQAVESDPSKYGLSQSEVVRRKRLVEEVGGEIEDMREELQKKIDSSHARVADLPHPQDFDEEGGYEEFEQQQQMRIMSEQDEQLDGVFHTVGNLRQQADDMGRELEEQREMLEVVDELADRVGGRLQTGMKKMQWVIKKNEDTMSSCCIGVLILVLIILLILVLTI